MKDSFEKLDKACEMYGMRTHVKKAKSMAISKEPIKMMVNLKGNKIERVKYFKYLGSLVTEDIMCINEVKVRVTMAKEVFDRKTDFEQ